MVLEARCLKVDEVRTNGCPIRDYVFSFRVLIDESVGCLRTDISADTFCRRMPTRLFVQIGVLHVA